MTHNSGVCGSASTETRRSFSVNATMCSPRSQVLLSVVSSGGAAQSARASLANRLAGAPLPLHWKKPRQDPVNLAQRWRCAASPAPPRLPDRLSDCLPARDHPQEAGIIVILVDELGMLNVET